MSVFGAHTHTPPVAPPPSVAGAVLPGGTLGSVFPIPSDASKQPSPAVYQPQFPVFSPASQYVSSGSAVFPRNAGAPVFFGNPSVPTTKQPMAISMSPPIPTGATRQQPAAAATPYFFAKSGVRGHTTPGSSAPVFGATPAFAPAVAPSNATGGLFSSGNTGASLSNVGGSAVKSISQPSSVFATSAFQNPSHGSPLVPTAPHGGEFTGNAAKKTQRTSFFSPPKGSGAREQKAEPQTCATPFASPPSRSPQSGAINKMMEPAVKRVKSESGLPGKRVAGRADRLQPADKACVALSVPKSAEPSGAATEQLLSTRVFTAFMRKILEDDEARREEAAEFLESAFFGVVGSHGSGNFTDMLQQMLSAWRTLKEGRHHNTQQHSPLKGDHWVALFAIGCHLNFVMSTILGGEAGRHTTVGERERTIILEKKWSVLANGCTYANLLCDICLQLFSNQSENHVPYSVLPLILRRARNMFELANDEGVSSVQPNIKTTLLKLHRYVRIPPLDREPPSVVAQQRTAAFACVLGEMMLHCCAPADSNHFIQSFHRHCSRLVEIRCTLYHHYAHNLLQEPLTDTVILEAMELLARALVIVPDDAKANKELLFLKLTACGLAMGRVTSPEEQQAYNVTGLEDLIIAVRSCNMQLFNISMRNNSELYVQLGVHNVLQVVGKRIALLMVVKYYVRSFSSRLPVQDMIEYYQLPLRVQEGCHVWLLPLLVEKRINGVMESGVLVLSSSKPFDDYSKEDLTAFSERSEGDKN